MHAIDPNDLSGDALWAIFAIIGLLILVAVGSLFSKGK